MRALKFKFWDTIDKKFIEDRDNVFINGLGVVYYGYTDIEIDQVAKELIPVQYIGLKDKNDKEIYEGYILHFTLKEKKKFGFEKRKFSGEFWNFSLCSTPIELIKQWAKTAPEKGYRIICKRLLKEYEKHKNNYSVEFDEGKYRAGFLLPPYKDFDMEIIGNIYENPEILKK